MLVYLKSRWPEDVVPKDMPTWFFWEVDSSRDVALRAVYLFDDGHSLRTSIQLIEEADRISCASVVEGPFFTPEAEPHLKPVTAKEFEALWRRSTDQPHL
jgi:hypothetical protein